MELGDEGRSTDAEHGVGGDDEAEIFGEMRLLNEAEGFSCIADADNIEELPLQN